MASIHEVAERAGVSITTVSHVFSGNRPVAEHTRARVVRAARELHYRPNGAARGLATGRTMTIGLHFPFEGDSFVLNPYFPELLEGLSAAAAEGGYGFLLIPGAGRATSPAAALLRGRRFDGVVVADPMAGDPLLPTVRRLGIPAVTTGRWLGRRPPPWVDNDHRGGIRDLLRHLDEQGYERPALISVRGGFSYIQDVEESFSEEARRRGSPGRIVRAEGLSGEKARDLAIRLLGQRHAPDAIVAASDRQAIGVLRAADELGIRVPAELGVAGEGDTVLARHSHPPLSSIRVRPRRLGEAAMGSLLALLDEAGPVENALLPAELIVRRSTTRRVTPGRTATTSRPSSGPA